MKKIYFAGLFLLSAGAVKAQLANGNMETWRTYTVSGTALAAPQGWHGLDSNIASFAPLVTGQKQLFKDTLMKHGGTAAARLESKNYPAASRVVPGVLSNANVSITIIPALTYSFSGGTAVSQRHASISAWVKYTPGAATDSASIAVRAVLQGTPGADGMDSVIGQGVMMLSTTANYTLVTVPITYTNATRTPTHIQIGFVSGSINNAVDGSQLWVDDVTINAPSGITQTLNNATVIKCYPNPTTGVLYLNSAEPESLTWEALNTTGQVIASKVFTQNATVQMNNMPVGVYYYRVFDRNKTLVQTGKFNLQ